MNVSFDAEKLQSKRKHLNLTQAMLAEKADTSERYVRSLEASKKVNPSAVLVFRLSGVLSSHGLNPGLRIATVSVARLCHCRQRQYHAKQ